MAMLEKARAVMPAKPAAPVKSGSAKGSGEPSRPSSGQFLATCSSFALFNMEFKTLVCSTASRSTEDLDSKPDVKKVRGGAAAKKVIFFFFFFCCLGGFSEQLCLVVFWGFS